VGTALLRAIQEGVVRPVGSTRTHSVNVRVVAATNRDVVAEVQAGRFRRDLYARLALWELKVPALRERRGDILSWNDIMKARWCAARKVTTAGPWSWSPEAVERLLLHPWPENLREVDRLVHRLLADGPDDEWIDTGDLDAVLGPALAPHGSEDAVPAESTQVQRTTPTQEALEAALETHGGSVRAVAKHFGRDRKQIYRWMERYGLK
jgi:DNA-binding NtrC family response regulator